MKNRIMDISITEGLYKRKFSWLNTCVYCGQIANSRDHVMPVSIVARLDTTRPRVVHELRYGLYIVPACNSCNFIAGKKPFYNILEKRAYLQARIREKYIKKLRTVMWDREEIEGLGYTMRCEVLKMLHNRYILEKRVNYPKLQTSIPADVADMLRLFDDIPM